MITLILHIIYRNRNIKSLSVVAHYMWRNKMGISYLLLASLFGLVTTSLRCTTGTISDTPEDSETPFLFGIYYNNVSVTICTADILEERAPLQFDTYEEVFWINPNDRQQRIRANTFSHLLNMKVLNMSSIKLYEIEASAFKELQNLQYLNLQNNALETLPADLFEDTPNLVRLYLQNNKLKYITENQVEKLRSLQKLDLSGNSLQVLPEGWDSSLYKVLRLFLHGNNFTLIRSEMFQKMRSLTILSLDHNKITTIEPNAFKGLTYLEFVSLDSNSDIVSDNVLDELKSLESLTTFTLSPKNFECSLWNRISNWANKRKIRLISTFDSCRDIRVITKI